MNITGICTYETPCGWCTKWDKKCDNKIGCEKGDVDMLVANIENMIAWDDMCPTQQADCQKLLKAAREMLLSHEVILNLRPTKENKE